ncbi:MAG: tetratricopeptide repeat protein [Thermoanaerobaculia bacterium]
MPFAFRRSLRPLTLALLVTGLAAAGTAAAFFLRSRRDVTTSSEEARKAYNEARENDLKMYEREAISGYATALQYDPHFVMATLRLAGKIRGRDPERAKSLLASAARSRDEITPREQLMLRIYEERWGRRDVATLGALYDEYLRRFPDDPEGYLMRCDFLAGQKRTAEALAEFERLLTVNPNYAIAYNTLGYASAARGDFAKAEDYLKRYRYLAPDQANPLDSLGELYALTGRYDEAEDVLKKALATKSDFFPAYGHLGTVEIGRGNPAKAAEYFLKASDEAAQPAVRLDFRFYASIALLDAGDEAVACKERDLCMAEAAGLSPGSEAERLGAKIAFYQAAFLAMKGETEGLDALLATASAAYEKEPDAEKKGAERDMMLVRGVAAARSGHCEDAVALLRGSQRLDSEFGLGGTQYYPAKDFAHVLVAGCLHDLGRNEEAEKELEPLLKRNPHFAPAVAVAARLKPGKPAAEARAARAAGAP